LDRRIDVAREPAVAANRVWRLHTSAFIEPSTEDALGSAKDAIWRLFDLGLIDEDSATLALLAISIGLRRTVRRDTSPEYHSPNV
jgi:hypothetical protein